MNKYPFQYCFTFLTLLKRKRNGIVTLSVEQIFAGGKVHHVSAHNIDPRFVYQVSPEKNEHTHIYSVNLFALHIINKITFPCR